LPDSNVEGFLTLYIFIGDGPLVPSPGRVSRHLNIGDEVNKAQRIERIGMM
jgi:hypothetical protein